MEAFKTYLQQFPNFTSEAYELALPYLQEVKLSAGEYFLQHGQVSRKLAFIQEGLFRIYYLKDGKELTHCFCKENSLTCSYKSLITQQPSEMAIQAVEDSVIYMFAYEDLQKFYEKDPFWQQVGRIASEHEYINVETHTRFLADLTATEKYLHVMQTDKELLQRVPLNYLASYLQIAPETLSRIRKKISIT